LGILIHDWIDESNRTLSSFESLFIDECHYGSKQRCRCAGTAYQPVFTTYVGCYVLTDSRNTINESMS
jgi:hypothetical protein